MTCPSCGAVEPLERFIGINVRGVYDGILIWRCETCHHMWPRFDESDRLHAAALEAIRGWIGDDQ